MDGNINPKNESKTVKLDMSKSFKNPGNFLSLKTYSKWIFLINNLERYTTEETVFKENLIGDCYQKTKSKTLLENESPCDERALGLDKYLVNNERIISKVANFNASANMSFEESLRPSAFWKLKLENSEEKKLEGTFTDRKHKLKGNIKKFKALVSENKPIISKNVIQLINF